MLTPVDYPHSENLKLYLNEAPFFRRCNKRLLVDEAYKRVKTEPCSQLFPAIIDPSTPQSIIVELFFREALTYRNLFRNCNEAEPDTSAYPRAWNMQIERRRTLGNRASQVVYMVQDYPAVTREALILCVDAFMGRLGMYRRVIEPLTKRHTRK